MPRPSRFDRVNRPAPNPSPLATVQYARPLSTLSSLNGTQENIGGDGRRLSVLPEQMAPDDAEFWQRFDVAARSIGMDEESMAQRDRSESCELREGRERTPESVESDRKSRNVWLEKQRKKRRRAHMFAWGIGSTIVGLIVMAAVVGWYFGKGGPNQHNHEDDNPSTD